MVLCKVESPIITEGIKAEKIYSSGSLVEFHFSHIQWGYRPYGS